MAHPQATKEEMLEKFGSIEDRLQKDPRTCRSELPEAVSDG